LIGRYCESRSNLSQANVIARSPKDDEAIFEMENRAFIYIMTNKNNTVLYTGVTSDLRKRVYEHKQKFIKGFTSK